MATTYLDALKSVNAYPIPLRTLVETANRRNFSLTAEATQECLCGKDYFLAKADLLLWLSFAPDISQGGQSFSFTDEQREQFRTQAQGIYRVFEPTTSAGCATFGYKGDRL